MDRLTNGLEADFIWIDEAQDIDLVAMDSPPPIHIVLVWAALILLCLVVWGILVASIYLVLNK
jgi:hypothetical protein